MDYTKTVVIEFNIDLAEGFIPHLRSLQLLIIFYMHVSQVVVGGICILNNCEINKHETFIDEEVSHMSNLLASGEAINDNGLGAI